MPVTSVSQRRGNMLIESDPGFMNEATTACQLAEPDLKAKSKVWVLALCVPLCCLLERSVIG